MTRDDGDVALVAIPRRYLVVDDDPDIAECISCFLRLSGNSVVTAGSGATALVLATGFDPHAALLDLAMPGLDGHETCRLLRAQPGGQSRLIVAVTAHGTADDIDKTRESGFDAVFRKPVEYEKLIGYLEQHLASLGVQA